jgi:hypothetical protein
MTNQGNTYSLEIDPQPAGTVISYYFTATDINGNLSAALPKGAHLPQFANLPFITLSGVQAMKTHDGDDNNQFGAWQAGLGSDNATTGQWEQDDPIGSYTVDVACRRPAYHRWRNLFLHRQCIISRCRYR